MIIRVPRLLLSLWAASVALSCSDTGETDPAHDEFQVFVETLERDSGLESGRPVSITTPNPWTDADAMAERDGVARIPVQTLLGSIPMAYEVVEGRIVVDGELDFGPVGAMADRRERGVGFGEVWFPDGTIRWFAASMTTASATAVREAMNSLEEHTPLNIIEVSSSSSSRKIEFHGTEDSWAYSGQAAFYWDPNLWNPMIRLSEDQATVKRGTVLHEMGHALGFPHEFQRPDRDQFVTVCSADPFNYAKTGEWFFSDDYALLSPFDFGSMMIGSYWGCVEAKGDFEQVVPKDSNNATQPMSQHDINSIYRVYGKALGTNDNGRRFGHATAAGDFDNGR